MPLDVFKICILVDMVNLYGAKSCLIMQLTKVKYINREMI